MNANYILSKWNVENPSSDMNADYILKKKDQPGSKHKP